MHETSHANRASRAEAPRRTWAKPTLTRITAVSAELNVGVVDDGVDLS